MKPMNLAVLLAALMAAIGIGTSTTRGQPGSGAQAGTVPSDVRSIFAQDCVECHGGTTPSGSVDLSTDGSVMKQVGRQALEKPGVPIIDPGNPGDSYLVMKIQGAGGIVGQRMPLRSRPLSEQEIQAIVSWIQGLPPSAGAANQNASREQNPGQASDSDTSAEELFDAAYTFRLHCSDCHGDVGQGIPLFGVPLRRNGFVLSSNGPAIAAVVREGRNNIEQNWPAYPGMPAFPFITGGRMEALIAYLKDPLQATEAPRGR